MFKTAKAKKRRFSAVLNVFKRFSNNSKTPPSKIEHKNEIARKTEDFLIFRAIFLTLQFSFTFPILSHSTQNITHFRHFLPFPIQFHPFPPFSTFLRFPCQLTIILPFFAMIPENLPGMSAGEWGKAPLFRRILSVFTVYL